MLLNQSSLMMPVVKRPPILMVRGEGSRLWDDAGTRYLDFIQGWAVNSLGHCPVEVTAALTAQGRQLINTSQAFYSAPSLELAAHLIELSGMHSVSFGNSGADANELAIKLARKFGKVVKGGAFQVVTTHGAFHGRTLATMAASGKPGWSELFPPYPEGFVKVPYADLDAMRRAITSATAAIMVEPIQGEAGVKVPPDGYLRALRELADECNLLLILDEVQTGIGRTGRLFAHAWEGIVPDVVTLGKGLGGGLPISAVLANRRASLLEVGEHGGTHHGNPLLAAVAVEVLRVVANPNFLRDVRDIGAHVERVLDRLCDRVQAGYRAQYRGKGLLWGIEFPSPIALEIVERSREHGLLINAPNPTTLRLMPSLRVTRTEVDEMAEILGRVLANLGA